MGLTMAAGQFLPLISWYIFANTVWILLMILAYCVWIFIFGRYIKRMLDRINRDYPKENSN